jgi:hypothetical protein
VKCKSRSGGFTQSATFDAVQSTNQKYHQSQRERAAEFKTLTLHVISAYTQLRALPLVCAVDPDQDALSRSKKWSPDIGHFLMDVELGTELALQDRPALQAAWMQIAQGEKVSPAISEEIYMRCGKFYRARKLDPRDYLRPSVRRSRAAAAGA